MPEPADPTAKQELTVQAPASRRFRSVALESCRMYSVVQFENGRVGVVSSPRPRLGITQVCFGEGETVGIRAEIQVYVLKTPFELATDFLYQEKYREVSPGAAIGALRRIAADEGKQLSKDHAARYMGLAQDALSGQIAYDRYGTPSAGWTRT